MFEDREWFAAAAAQPAILEQLRRASPVQLPASYYEVLAATNGGEGPLPVQPFNLCLDAADQVIGRIRSGPRGLDGFPLIGSDGGGEYIAFDLRGSGPLPVVSLDMVAGPASAREVAADFDQFIPLIGRGAG